MSRNATIVAALLAVVALAQFPTQANADDAADLGCSLQFSLSTWSTLHKHSEGSGVITCENGGLLRVRIVATGAGLAGGKSPVDGGRGVFTDVHSIGEILGAYTRPTEGARVKVSERVLSKGAVSLALAGRGDDAGLGVGIGEFILTRDR